MIVVDASAILDFLLQRLGFESLQRRLLSDSSWHAPHLIDLEVAQAVRRWTRANKISGVRGQRMLELHADLPIRRWPHQPFLGRIWRLRANLTAYDAAYVSLAETLDVPLVTRDSRIAAASGHNARVERFE